MAVQIAIQMAVWINSSKSGRTKKGMFKKSGTTIPIAHDYERHWALAPDHELW